MKSGRLLALVLFVVPACYAQLDFTSIFGPRHSAGLAPVAFEPETAAATSFISQAQGCSVRIDSGEIRVTFAREGDTQPEVVRIIFEGAGPGLALPSDPLPGVIHYYSGANPSDWRTDIHRYRQVRFREVYSGIDLSVHGGDDGPLEFDFEVAPGGRLRDISLRFDEATVQEFKGNLEITTPAGRVFTLKKPNLYQLRAGKRLPVRGSYK